MTPVLPILLFLSILFILLWRRSDPGSAGDSDSGAGLELRNPVSLSQEGITVVINAVRADAEKTRIEYSVAGVCPIGRGAVSVCTDPPLLRMPDGAELHFTEMPGFGCSSDTYWPIPISVTFPPLPKDRTQFYFVVPCPFPELFVELSKPQ